MTLRRIELPTWSVTGVFHHDFGASGGSTIVRGNRSPVVELDGGDFPDFSKVPQRHYQNQVFTNQFLYAILAEEKCQKAGVEIAYYEFPQAVTETGDGWQVDCVGFGTKRRVRCKQIIDCTGGAEVVGLSGLPRLREEERQPGSFLYMMGKPHEPGRNQIHRLYVHGADSTNSRTVTQANLTGRRSILTKLRADGQRLMHLQPETGFRESYRNNNSARHAPSPSQAQALMSAWRLGRKSGQRGAFDRERCRDSARQSWGRNSHGEHRVAGPIHRGRAVAQRTCFSGSLEPVDGNTLSLDPPTW